MCRTHVSHKWLYHLDVCAGSVLTPHDNITNVQKRLGNKEWSGFDQCRLCGFLLGPTAGTRRKLQQRRSHARRHNACVHAVVCRKLADPGIIAEPRGLTASQSRTADIFTTAAVPGRGAVLDVCVASSVQQQPEETPRRRQLIANYRCRDEISELRKQGIYNRPLVGTADGRPHPAVTRTMQYAADIASGRNGQQMSAKSLQRRWKHEIQIALPRRRAAMTRAVLPNPWARAEWLLAGIIDRVLHHWGHVPPLDGGPGDQDHADSETDTHLFSMTHPKRRLQGRHSPSQRWSTHSGGLGPRLRT